MAAVSDLPAPGILNRLNCQPVLQKRLAAFALLFLTLAACQPETGLEIRDPWLRASAPGQTSGAGYLTLTNHEQRARTLIAVQTPMAGSVMFHESRESEGVARMSHLPVIEIGAGKTVQLAPGGKHLMLMSLAGPLVAGERYSMTLIFKDGERETLEFEARKPH